MEPRIEFTNGKKLIGQRMQMSFARYTAADLWREFMPRLKEIENRTNSELISMVIYPENHFADFKPTNLFERWAATEVDSFDAIPSGMETFLIPAGWYAVFDYKGMASDPAVFEYIFKSWLPASDFKLDNRPHFEVLDHRYRNNDASSEEQIWIPIKPKGE